MTQTELILFLNQYENEILEDSSPHDVRHGRAVRLAGRVTRKNAMRMLHP